MRFIVETWCFTVWMAGGGIKRGMSYGATDDFSYNIAENPHAAIDLFAKVVGQGIAVRRFGSAALDLAWLAAGRFDGFWEVALQPWDVAAGILIATEAGGTISSYGAPAKTTANDADIIVDRVLGSNGHLNAELHRLLFDPSG